MHVISKEMELKFVLLVVYILKHYKQNKTTFFIILLAKDFVEKFLPKLFIFQTKIKKHNHSICQKIV